MTHTGQISAIDAIVTAEIPMPHGYVFRADGSLATRLRKGLSKRGEMLSSKCLAYALRHPQAGVVLVDTGFHPDAQHDLRRDFGLPMSLLFRDIEPASLAFDAQLRAIGVQPDAVERVVMTHLHVDHTSGMRLLPNATFVCSRREWAAAHRRFAAANGYVAHHLPDEARMELLDFEAEAESYGPFDKTLDLLGDGSVRLIFTPGHTRGHVSVLVDVVGGRRVLLVGDAAYTLRSIEDEVLPMLSANDEASRRSLHQLNRFRQDDPEAILVPTHDPDAWRGLDRLKTAAASPGDTESEQPLETP